MKKFIKLLAVALAAAALAGCSLVSINTEKITVATVGDETITKAAFDEAFNAFLAQYGYTQDSTEIADQLPDLKEQYINMMVQNLVIDQKIEELGLGEVTDEEKAAAEQSVQDWYDEQFAQLVETYSADETVEDPEAEAITTIENYLSHYGTTLEQMKQEEVDYIPTQKLYDEVTKDITVTEEEIESQFATLVSEAKTKYDEDKSAFVTDYQSGNTIYYTPEGMFFVKHILIGLTEEQQQEIKDLRADEDETVAATADAKRDEYLLTIREEAEAVLARVDAGEDFDALIEEYGDDPGMSVYPDGYLTYAGDTSFVDEFAAACEALTEDGMTSGLVGSDFGYHIIRRVSTLPAGEATLADVHDALQESMLQEAKDTAYSDQIAAWVEEANVTIETGRL